MFKLYNPNPVRPEGGAGDCTVRAISMALGIGWEDAYSLLCTNGFLMGEMPSSDLVWGSVLRQHGFTKELLPNTCPDCYTVKDFCKDHPKGTYAIKSNGHVAVVQDGNLFDSWDSSMNVPIYIWKKGEK